MTDEMREKLREVEDEAYNGIHHDDFIRRGVALRNILTLVDALLEAEEESGAPGQCFDYAPDVYAIEGGPVEDPESTVMLVFADGTRSLAPILPAVKWEAFTGEDAKRVVDGYEHFEHGIRQPAPEPEPEEGEPDKMTDHLMRVAELATHEERIEALENQGHVLFLGSNTLKRIEALEEEMKEERERVWYDIGKIKQRLGIAMQLIRDEAKQAKHVENRLVSLEKRVDDHRWVQNKVGTVYCVRCGNNFTNHVRETSCDEADPGLWRTPEPDSEPEAYPGQLEDLRDLMEDGPHADDASRCRTCADDSGVRCWLAMNHFGNCYYGTATSASEPERDEDGEDGLVVGEAGWRDPRTRDDEDLVELAMQLRARASMGGTQHAAAEACKAEILRRLRSRPSEEADWIQPPEECKAAARSAIRRNTGRNVCGGTAEAVARGVLRAFALRTTEENDR